MEMKALLLLLLAALLSQNMAIEDQKTYYSPDPKTPPVSHTPPSHATPPPSHGGGYGHPPPANCGDHPPSGGDHHTTPSPPTGGGGGGYYHSPPPTIVTPPTPGITIPSPPFSFDPHSPPFTCNYWRNHPTLIWGLFGGWGTTLGSAFGLSSVPRFGSNMNILQALSNTRTDGLGELYRQGTAALLNSMAHSTSFPFTTSQVRDSFVAALSRSNEVVVSQAQIFKQANEGRIKTRA